MVTSDAKGGVGCLGRVSFLTLAVLAPINAAWGCSLSALDGFSSTPATAGTDGGDGGDHEGGVILDDGAPRSDGGPWPGPGACTAPYSSGDEICATFDVGAPESGWSLVPGNGIWSVGAGQSAPNAVQFILPNSGPASTGHHLAKAFAGSWSRVECSFSAALDELPPNGTFDIATATSASPTSDDVGLRVYAANFALISCRNGSDCRTQESAGAVPSLGEFHRYRLEWTSSGDYRFSLDDEPRATIATKTPLSGQAIATVAFGAIYRPYGSGGSFRVRHDDIACVRAP
jgi:hypothetical protein